MTAKSSKRWVRLALIGLTVAVAALWIGYWQGNSMASEQKARLVSVWLDLMAMTTSERALLVSLSIACHLEEVDPGDARGVVDCLRRGVEDPDGMLPIGVRRDEARQMLDRLLSRDSGTSG